MARRTFGATGGSLPSGPVAYETLIHEWRAGERRVDEAPAAQRAVLDRVVTAQVALSCAAASAGRSPSTSSPRCTPGGTDWMLELAQAVAPDAPSAWEASVADAAFARYLREATDFAGGRRY